MAVKQRIKDSNKKAKRPLFVRERMWLQYLLSNYFKDIGKIPKDIGNNILITNNMYISSEYLSSMIQLHVITHKSPVTLIKCLNEQLRDLKIPALLDMTIKNNEFYVNLQESGLKSRIRVWEAAVQDTSIEANKQVAKCATLLYTANEAKRGKKLYKSKISLTVRAKNRTDLTKAENAIFTYMDSMDWEYKVVTDVRDRLRYMSLLSDSRDSLGADIPSVITSNTVLSQVFANGSSYNDDDGVFMGVDVFNNTAFKLNLNNITVARNLYLIAPSGVGKTVMASKICESAIEKGMHCSITDIKGNEFVNFTKSNNGVIVSLRPSSEEYICSFKMYKDECTDSTADSYFKSRVSFSRSQLLILSGISREHRQEASELLEEFFNALYIYLGAVSTNRNSWFGTMELSAYKVFEHLDKYVTPAVISRFPNAATSLIKSLRTYMSEDGSESHIFKKELNYKSMLNAPVLMFDFGLLDNANNSLIDMNIFELKFAYMRKINGEYVTNKYNKGIKVLKILEESQVVNEDIMKAYVEEYTLRRAQGQTTILIGNSVQALMHSKIAEPLIENTKALLIGKLPDSALSKVLKEFDLYDYEDILRTIGTSEETENAFLFVNNMEPRPLVPLLKFQLNKNVKYELHTPTKTGGGQ